MRLFRAPGRINLIGDHTDYNGGFAMPAAIGIATTLLMSPRQDQCVSARAEHFSETITFQVGPADRTPQGAWGDYVRGIAVVLEAAGYRLRGADLFIQSEIPLGAGLSSSAALEVASALAMLARSGIELDKLTLARLCQRAENEFVGVRSGILDQLAVCMGRSGYAMLLDCRSLEIEYVAIPERAALVVCNSMVRRALASGEYNRRREECEKGVQRLSHFLPEIRQLRDVSLAELNRYRAELDPIIFRRCRHVVSENQRTLDAAEALRNEDVNAFGAFMSASHESLRDDYQVSCVELDALVEIATGQPGVYGSRMMGGGFGGCIISIVDKTSVESFVTNVTKEYVRRMGIACDTYVCDAADGAGEKISK